MKRILYAFILLSTSVSSATEWTFNPDSALRSVFTFSSGYYFASNAVTNDFARAYFNNEFIDDALKDKVSSNLESSNRLGGELNSVVGFMRRNDTVFSLPHSFFSITASNHYHVNSEFTKDAFELFFRGNKPYAGKTAQLSDFTYNQVFYQQINFTFGHKYKYESNMFEYSAGLSLNKGQKYYNITSPRATLFTQSAGEYLDLDANIKIHESDSAHSEYVSWNGTGLSGNFSFSWKDKKQNVLNFSLDNFGFIGWNSKTAFVQSDTAFRFEGVDVTDLFQFGDSVKETISLDSSLVQPYLSAREEKSYSSPLPALASLSYRYILSPGRMDIEGGLSYLFFAGSTLQENLTLGFMFNNIHRITLRASYGGYTGFQAGLAYKVFIAKCIMLTAQSDYLTGLINYETGTAQDAFVSLSVYF